MEKDLRGKVCLLCHGHGDAHYGTCPSLEVSRVEKVYTTIVAKKEKCRCGCSGSYSENPRRIKAVLNKYHKAESTLVETGFKGQLIVSFDDGPSTFTIYFKPSEKAQS